MAALGSNYGGRLDEQFLSMGLDLLIAFIRFVFDLGYNLYTIRDVCAL